VLLCLALLTLGGAAVKGWEELTAEDPWNVRADQVCLDAGNEYLNVEGSPTSRIRQQIEISQTALDYLKAIGDSVPLPSTLKYQSMLGDKEEILSLFRRELKLMLEGQSTSGARGQLKSVLLYSYAPDAEELGLDVCGQGSGNQ
jgi:hypothetical protein